MCPGEINRLHGCLAYGRQAPEDLPITPATRQLIHKSLLSFTRYFFPAVSKIYSADTSNEAAILARALCESIPGGSRGDDGRAYIVAEGSGGVRWISTEDGETGRLEIVGTVRGGCLSADQLVHLPGHGDFQVESVSAKTYLIANLMYIRSWLPAHRYSLPSLIMVSCPLTPLQIPCPSLVRQPTT